MSTIHREDEVLGKAYDGRLMRRLLRYVRSYTGAVVGSILLLLAVSGLQILQPYVLKIAVDEHLGKGLLEGLAGIALIYLALLVAESVAHFIQRYVMQRTGQQIMFDLRTTVFRRFGRLPLSHFDRNPVGRLMTRVTTDVENLNEMFTQGLVAVFGDIVSAVGIVIAMLLLDFRLSLVTFAILPVVLVVAQVFRTHAREAYRLVRTKLAVINAFLQESISGMRIIQLFSHEERSNRAFERINREYRGASLRTMLYFSLFYPGVELIAAIALALILWYGGGQVVQGALSLGTLIAFILYAERFFAPIRDLSEKYNIMQAAMASSERIFELLDTPEEAGVRQTGGRRVERLRGALEFRHVNFSYTRGDEVLKDVSFLIAPGEKVALVGATGAGKSTIAGLVNRLYEPTGGQILLDGVDVREYELSSLRRRIGLVLQEPFLFSGSVEENISLGKAEIEEEQIEWAVRLTGADHFVERLPARYKEAVRERGVALSVGERQLLSFARVLAYDPDILILDEATSSVDAESEAAIQRAIASVTEGRTCLIIAHRLSTIRGADRILVLHHGELCEEGTHASLIQQRGIYARLYELQFNGRQPCR
ncbi:MAG TPA: ABC transporter ATP-binding protein [Methylomirabilota bacterium]|nr:ABC transporter ATP-binding protein [Methylomirabilota bacterium]